jgi:hypothetical protein
MCSNTGKLCTTPLLYLADASRIIIVASSGGTAQPPWLSLQHRPNALVQIGRQKIEVRAVQVEDSENSGFGPSLSQCTQHLLNVNSAHSVIFPLLDGH